MRVAIVTPYFKETDEQLIRCNDSVRNQTHQCTHIMVSDGHPNPLVENLNCSKTTVEHIRLPHSNSDYGDTPRLIGAVYAHSQGYDALCFLDADNWLEPDHVEQMAQIVNLNPTLELVTATRNLRRPDGSLIGVDRESNGKEFNDTNCYFLLRPAMHSATAWGFKDKKQSIIGDRYVWELARRHVCDHNPNPTVNYTTTFAAHYVQHGQEIPEDAKVIVSEDSGKTFHMESFKEFRARV